MTVILAADTSTSLNTVALTRDDVLLAEATVHCQRLHAERLLATVDWLLQEAQVDLNQVDAFAVAQGPGSFTGVRIGVSTWKGLAFGMQKPLIGVSTLDALARQCWAQQGILCPLLDARMREVYGAVYGCTSAGVHRVTPESAGAVDVFVRQAQNQSEGPVVFAGDGAHLYWARIVELLPEAVLVPPLLGHPRAAAVAVEARHILDNGGTHDGSMVTPVYLRQSQAEQHRARARAGAV